MDLTWQQRLRALVITGVLVVHGIYALPRPHRVRTAELAQAEVREEISHWAELLGTDAETFGPLVVRVSGRASDVYQLIRRPFRAPLRFFGVGQAWAMFATPDTYPHRLEIDVRIDGTWEPLYRRWEPSPWLEGPLRNRRVRGIYDGATNKDTGAYWNFTRWVAKQAFLDVPAADRVRVRMFRTHTTPPGTPADPRDEPRQTRVLKRSAILPEDGLVP